MLKCHTYNLCNNCKKKICSITATIKCLRKALEWKCRWIWCGNILSSLSTGMETRDAEKTLKSYRQEPSPVKEHNAKTDKPHQVSAVQSTLNNTKICKVSQFPCQSLVILFLLKKSEVRGRILQRSEAKDFLMQVKIEHFKLSDLLFIHYYRLREMPTEHQSHVWTVPVILDTVTQDDFIPGCHRVAQPTEPLICPLAWQDRPLQACNAVSESNTKQAANLGISSLLHFQARNTEISEQQRSRQKDLC